jgi:hypothetical protein
MTTARPTRRRLDVAVQAETWFGLYYAMGAKRSLASLRERGGKLWAGKPPAHSTIDRWSADYHWQERIAELDAEAARANTAEQVRTIQRMNEDQATIGAMGVQVAAFALERILRQLRMGDTCDKCGVAPLDLDAQDIARLMEVFAKWQRIGLGEVTDRTEVQVQIWNIAVPAIVALFLQINIYDEPERRVREFATGVDQIVGEHMSTSR